VISAGEKFMVGTPMKPATKPQVFNHADVEPKPPRLEQSSQRDHVAAARHGVDFRIANQQLLQPMRSAHCARALG
jgi:hypothetical protein